jgi:DNA-binding NtrC family response regulator
VRDATNDRRGPLLSGLKLLIVDDDEDLRYVVSRRLRQLGADVQDEGRLRQVREKIGGWTPQVAVIDAHLPDGDGLAFGAALLAELPDLRIIFLTGDADAMSAREDAPGRIWHLLKPVSLEELQRTILRACQGNLPHPAKAPAASAALVW